MPGLEGRGNGELFNGYRVSVRGNGKVLETDGGDGCTTMQMCLMPLTTHLNNKFWYAYFITICKRATLLLLFFSSSRTFTSFSSLFKKRGLRQAWCDTSGRSLEA